MIQSVIFPSVIALSVDDAAKAQLESLGLRFDLSVLPVSSGSASLTES